MSDYNLLGQDYGIVPRIETFYANTFNVPINSLPATQIIVLTPLADPLDEISE